MDLRSAKPIATFGPADGDAGGFESVAMVGALFGGEERAFAIGAPDAERSSMEEGAVYLWGGALDPGDYDEDGAALTVRGDAGAGLGSALDGGQDLDDDGSPDLAMGGADAASVFMLLSSSLNVMDSDAEPQVEIVGGGATELGSRVDLAPDVNGDGVAELAFPAPGGGMDGEGAAHVVFGPMTPGVFVLEDVASSWTGDEDLHPVIIVGVGDFTGDGYGDLAVGAPTSSRSGGGATWIVPGGAEASSDTSLDEAGERIEGSEPYLDQSIAMAGDVNADGFADLFVGDANEEDDSFNVRLLLGGDEPEFEHLWIQGNAESGAEQALSSGDVDGDGNIDLLMGGSEADIEAEGGEGVVLLSYLVNGEQVEAGSFTWREAGARVGASVDASGDVSGDGISDVAVSAPGVEDGRVFVLSGCW